MDRINREIRALAQTRTHGELVVALQRVLVTMSYYISQSEGIVLDEQERWHGDYTDALYAEAGTSARPGARAPRPGPHDGAPPLLGPAPHGQPARPAPRAGPEKGPHAFRPHRSRGHFSPDA